MNYMVDMARVRRAPATLDALVAGFRRLAARGRKRG